MLLEWLRRWWSGLGRWQVVVLTLWWVCVFGIVGRLCIHQPGRQSLYPVYYRAGLAWRGHHDLYPEHKADYGYPLYRYSPLIAALLAPLTRVSYRAGDIGWRFLNCLCLLSSLLWWHRIALPSPLSRGWRALLLLLILPLALGNLNNGQCNILVLAMILAGLAAVVEQRWLISGALLALACLIKVYPIALVMLLGLLYGRRFLLPFLAALAIGALLPLAWTDHAYVVRQYHLWIAYMKYDDRADWALEFGNLDFRLLWRVWIGPMSVPTYRLLQVGTGAIAAVLCLRARRAGWSGGRLLTLVLGVAGCWMTVFGPATESPTYVYLAPTAAWLIVDLCTVRHSWLVRGLAALGWVLLLSAQTSTWVPTLYLPYRALGPQPLGGLFLTAALLIQVFHRPAAETVGEQDTLQPIATQAA